MNYADLLVKAGYLDKGIGCAHCGKPIPFGGLFTDCADCAAIFCEDCVKDGTLANHNCEDYDWDD